MNFKTISILTLVTISSLILAGCNNNDGRSNEDKVALAQCLTNKGAIMHGTNSCSHCTAQKELFGYEAFAQIDFVNCEAERNKCALAGVKAFPTWTINGQNFEGQKELAELAQIAGCEDKTTN